MKTQNDSAQHTPGPWRADILDSYGRFEIRQHDGGRTIARPGSAFGCAKTAEENDANARLIAAAPELLAAAEAALKHADMYASRRLRHLAELQIADGQPYHEAHEVNLPAHVAQLRAAVSRAKGITS